MEMPKLTDFVYEAFSRFLIAGFVFCLFAIWLPSALFLRESVDFLYEHSLFLLMICILVGLTLDMSRFYRLTWFLLKSGKQGLECAIVRAFDIKIEYDTASKEHRQYRKRTAAVARQIHESYIRTCCPDVYAQIRQSRIYPDILAMTFISILVFLLFDAATLIFLLFDRLASSNTTIVENIRSLIHNDSNHILLMVFLLGVFATVLIKGKIKVVHQYRTTTDTTAILIREAFHRESGEHKTRFFSLLEQQGLIVNDNKIWKIKDGEQPVV